MTNKVKSELAPAYNVVPLRPVHRDPVVSKAIALLEEELNSKGPAVTSPQIVRDYLFLQLATLRHEVFGVIYLDNRHRIIACVEEFRGTIDGASVHPREIVKAALSHNASAVVFYHNHPSGVAEPSRADDTLTRRLKEALSLIDIRVLDHLIVGDKVDSIVSFAERGLI